MKPKAPATTKQIDDDLALGMKHLAEANMALLRQRRLIFRLSAKGEPTFDAEALFADMVQTLRIMSERLMVLEVAGDVSKSPLGPNATKLTTTAIETPLAMRPRAATNAVR